KGDMSFVGPRPERPEFVRRLAEKIPYYAERHRLKPGLSGWAQICYPYGASAEDGLEKLQYDLYYVKNYSILLDMLILLQTAEVVLLGRGAH
ncbi:MAG: sugar transferase, partial [Gammaproteobacteria bacterium]|nr:sugar transferase [Gammaproteobacteria bacterium]